MPALTFASTVAAMIEIGSPLPAFTLPDHAGTPTDSSILTGGWFLLFWYPRADTPGCTAQAEGLRDQIETFEELGCDVLGASFDPPDANGRVPREGIDFPSVS